MKSRIVTYLFIFSILYILFQYVSSKRFFEKQSKSLEKYKTQAKTYKDSLNNLAEENFELSFFNLPNNDDALLYFERDGFNTDNLIPIIKDAIYETNFSKPHPLVSYKAGQGKRITINTVRFLNHKWFIASFSDNTITGEILVKYFVNTNNTVDFEVIDEFLYPIN